MQEYAYTYIYVCNISVCVTQTGYKEREDRIAELEEFINDQVTELDKMEAAMKQTVANKKLLEKDYQKLEGDYNLAKVCAMFIHT